MAKKTKSPTPVYHFIGGPHGRGEWRDRDTGEHCDPPDSARPDPSALPTVPPIPPPEPSAPGNEEK